MLTFLQSLAHIKAIMISNYSDHRLYPRQSPRAKTSELYIMCNPLAACVTPDFVGPLAIAQYRRDLNRSDTAQQWQQCQCQCQWL